MTELASTDAADIIATAQLAAMPMELEPGCIYLVQDNGTQTVVDTDRQAAVPRRATRTVTVRTPESFVTYMADKQSAHVEVWADEPGRTITGILNPPTATQPAWADHRCKLALRLSPEWQRWTDLDGKLLKQETFAEHIEDNLAAIVRPEGAEMLELAQSFQAANHVTFESAKFLDSGRRVLEYRENLEARAGRRGQIEIPTEFELGIAPFVGLPAFRVTARLRYRITEGGLVLGYKLNRVDDVLRAAFADAADVVAQKLGVVVLEGLPQ